VRARFLCQPMGFFRLELADQNERSAGTTPRYERVQPRTLSCPRNLAWNDSDRLFASWELDSSRVIRLAISSSPAPEPVQLKPAALIEIPANWGKLCREDAVHARKEQLRVRSEFQQALAAGLIAAGFERSKEQPRYLLYPEEAWRSVQQ